MSESRPEQMGPSSCRSLTCACALLPCAHVLKIVLRRRNLKIADDDIEERKATLEKRKARAAEMETVALELGAARRLANEEEDLNEDHQDDQDDHQDHEAHQED